MGSSALQTSKIKRQVVLLSYLKGIHLKTTMTLENENGSYSVSVPCGELRIDDLITDILIPVLLAAQYSKEAIEKALQNE